MTTVSAASFEKVALTPDSIASAFGTKLATTTAHASDIDAGTPVVELPTNLAGTTVQVDGQFAGLLYVSPEQVNFVIPSGVSQGTVAVKITSGDGTESTGTLTIVRVQPAIFTFNSNGRGVLAAEVVRVKTDGSQTRESLAIRHPMTNEFITKPINFGPDTDRIFLEIYLTGIRGILDNNSDGNLNENVWVLIGGQALTPSYAGRQPFFAGLDQVNVELPRSLNGKGKLNLAIHAITGNAVAFRDPGVTSQRVELEAGNANPGPLPTVTGLSATSAKVGDIITITGTGFAPNPAENVVTVGGVRARVEEASSTQLIISVPYGAVTGRVKVVTAHGESTNLLGLNIRTSVTGHLQTSRNDGVFPAPLRNIIIRVAGTNISTLTNAEGLFTLLDVPTGDATIEVDPTAFPVAGTFPKVNVPLTVISARDNYLPHSIWLTPTGMLEEKTPSITVSTVTGVVYDLDGVTPVANARVRAYDDTFNQVTQTDDSGAFIIRNVPMSLAIRIVAESARLDGRVLQAFGQATTQRAIGFFSSPVIANLSFKDAPTNRPPLLIAPHSVTMNVDETKEVTIFADDPDVDETLQVAVSGPQDISIIPGLNGAFTIRLAPKSGGTFTVKVTAMDSKGIQVAKEIALTVIAPNTAPAVTVPGAKTVSAGQTLTFDVSATDPDAGQTITLVAMDMPSGASFIKTSSNPLTGTFSWTPNNNQIGTYTVKFTAQDNGFGTLSESKTVTITVSSSFQPGIWTTISASLPNTVTTIAVEGNDVYVGVYNNGVYVTSDYGMTWKRISNGLPTTFVRSLAISGNTIFAVLDSVGGVSVYRSLDKGENWTVVNTNFKSIGTRLATHEGRVIVYDLERADISTDQGSTWSKLTESQTNNIIAVDGRGTVFVRGSDNKIYKLGGTGTTISLIPSVLFPGNMPTTVGTTTTKMFIATNQLNPYIDYLYMSTDGGINWVDAPASFPVADYRLLYGVGSKLFAITHDGKFVSDNGGITWDALSWPFVEILASNDNFLFLKSGGSLLVMPLQ